MLALVGVVLLAAAPVRVATTGWTFSGVPAAVGDAFVDRFATQLAASGMKVTTQKDIAGVLGLERQKELMGCTTESSNCLAELAGALGVDAILTGSVVKIGASFTVTLRVIGVQNGAELASASERLKSEDDVQDWLDDQAHRLAEKVTQAVRGEAPVATVTTTGRSVRLLPWVPGALGVVLLAVGRGLYAASSDSAARLRGWPMGPPNAPAPEDLIRNVRTDGERLETTSFALFAVGGAAIAATVIWLLFDKPGPAVAISAVTGGGAWVGISGSLP